jgi:extracellular factor (EF) 3-hydroxypalmitic acid methyl ester biosynthesis protein
MTGVEPMPFDCQSAPEPTLRGELVRGGARQAVTLGRPTATSLRVAFDGEVPPGGTVFDALEVDVQVEGDGGRRRHALSRCRFLPSSADRYAGLLVFLDEVYDARALVFDRELVSRRAAIESVPLLMARREGVRPEFREYVADAMYEMSVWRKFFDDEERVLEGEPPEVAAAGREALLEMHAPKFFTAFDRQLAALGALVKDFNAEEHERHGFYFRRQAWPYISASESMRRTNLKPYGYAGDAEMMRMIYENAWAGQTLFEKVIHKHTMRIPAAQAVRNRRHLVADELRRVAATFPTDLLEGFRFLSVAAGPAWELHDIYRTREDAERFRCGLLDQDPHALAAAKEVVHRIERERHVALRVDWYQDSVRTMLRPFVIQRYGRQHFVYSMGLFDYLATPVARSVLSRMYDLLVPGGVVMVGNYHASNPSRVYMEYWADWKLIYRVEENMLALAAEVPQARASVGYDASCCQMFLRLEKPGAGPP